MPSAGWRLFAPGVDITLGDGKSYTLKFDMRTVLLVEEHYGGLTAFMDSIKSGDDPWGPGRVKRLVDAMEFAIMPKLGRDELIDALAFTDFVRYLQALTDAWYEAMPDSDEAAEEAGETDPNSDGSADGSLGSSSTISPPSAMAAATRSSGA